MVAFIYIFFTKTLIIKLLKIGIYYLGLAKPKTDLFR